MKYKKIIVPYLGIGMGSVVMALSVTLFIGPNKIVPGGVMGIANIIHHLMGLPIGLTTLCFSIPIFILGILTLGKTTGVKTIYCNIVYALVADITANIFPMMTDNLLLSAVFGGVLMGLGVGIILGFGGTFGGTDLLARIINRYIHALPIQWIMFSIDFLVVIGGGIVFGPELALFSIITIFVSTKMVDVIQEGANYGKLVYIISEKSEEIADVIMRDIVRGVTALNGRGMYTNTDKYILFCIVKRGQVMNLKKIVLSIDPKAFITIGDVREVVGNGFESLLFSKGYGI